MLPRKLTRREFLGLGALGGLGYMRFGEPHWLGTGRHAVPLGGGGAEPVTLLQLADFHASEVVSLDFIERAVRLGLEAQPDLICLTGDFITDSGAGSTIVGGGGLTRVDVTSGAPLCSAERVR